MKLLLLLLPFCLFGQNPTRNVTLDEYFKQLDPEIQVSMKLQNQSGEVLYEKNSQKVVPSASVIKIPILMSFFSAKDQKYLKLKTKYILQPKDIVAGSGDLQFEIPFTKHPYFFIAQKMIAVSDNTATNILIEKLGMENIQQEIEEWELKTTNLRRKMMDFDAIKAGKQNTTTAEDMNSILLKLLNKQVLSDKSGKQALEILLGCEDRTTIPRNIPLNIPIAHKTGTLDYVRGDAGIIFSKNILVLSVFVENFESQEQAETIIGKIGELSYLNFGE
jgi:beta-lactamase class A